MENILSITRFSGSAQLKKTPELPEEIVENAVKNFRKRHPEIQVSVRIPEEPMLVPMDPILIEQVFVNILENAVLHGGTTKEILITVEQSAGSAVFTIADNGCGIPEDILPHLFDGSLKLNKKKSDSSRSMRIGLSVCKAILDAHDGIMAAGNRPEGGAFFRFSLPLEERKDGN